MTCAEIFNLWSHCPWLCEDEDEKDPLYRSRGGLKFPLEEKNRKLDTNKGEKFKLPWCFVKQFPFLLIQIFLKNTSFWFWTGAAADSNFIWRRKTGNWTQTRDRNSGPKIAAVVISFPKSDLLLPPNYIYNNDNNNNKINKSFQIDLLLHNSSFAH